MVQAGLWGTRSAGTNRARDHGPWSPRLSSLSISRITFLPAILLSYHCKCLAKRIPAIQTFWFDRHTIFGLLIFVKARKARYIIIGRVTIYISHRNKQSTPGSQLYPSSIPQAWYSWPRDNPLVLGALSAFFLAFFLAFMAASSSLSFFASSLLNIVRHSRTFFRGMRLNKCSIEIMSMWEVNSVVYCYKELV